MLRKALVTAILMALLGSVRAGAAVPDFRDYQALLDKYITRLQGKGQPLETRFDYEQLYVDEKIWTLKRSALLEKMHEQMLSVPPSTMTPAEREAWSLNTYNFLVIEHATLHLLIPRQEHRKFKFLRYKNVDQIKASGVGFFDARIATIEGREYSIGEFERRFVYGDTSGPSVPRAAAHDPRIRFATNPGRVGYPPLLPYAFHPDSLDRQLDRAARNALAMPRFVTVKLSPPLLLVSDLMARDLGDFGGTMADMLAFVEKYVPRAVRDDIKKAKLTSVSRFTQPAMELNQKEHPKVVVPSPPDSSNTSS